MFGVDDEFMKRYDKSMKLRVKNKSAPKEDPNINQIDNEESEEKD